MTNVDLVDIAIQRLRRAAERAGLMVHYDIADRGSDAVVYGQGCTPHLFDPIDNSYSVAGSLQWINGSESDCIKAVLATSTAHRLTKEREEENRMRAEAAILGYEVFFAGDGDNLSCIFTGNGIDPVIWDSASGLYRNWFDDQDIGQDAPTFDDALHWIDEYSHRRPSA